MTIEIRESYAKFRAQLVTKVEELVKTKKLGEEYARFWKFVGNCLNNELLILHTMSLLTTTLTGLNSIPDQFIKLAEILMRSADELKALLAEVAMEKSDKSTFVLTRLVESFESGDKLITESMSKEQDFDFPEASAVHVYTVNDVDIPLPATNGITITEMPKNKLIDTINKAAPKYNKIIKGNHIKISAKIDYVANEKDLAYKGFSIKLVPKVCELSLSVSTYMDKRY